MRLAVLDVGSNTVHLQVVDAHYGARPIPTFNYKEELRLTQFLNHDNFISQAGIDALDGTIERALAQAKGAAVEEFLPFATSALRDAKNGKEIIDFINRKHEIELQVLSGEDEAKLTFLAARRWYGWSAGRLLMIDIGGGSLEFGVGVDESPEVAVSLPLGAGRLTQNFLTGDPFSTKSIRTLRDHIESQLEAVLAPMVHHEAADRAIGTSKTLRTLARICSDFYGTNSKQIELDSLRKATTKLAEMNLDQRSKLPGVSNNRANQIVAGAFVAESVMRNLDIDKVEICPWALREGLILRFIDWHNQ